MKKTAHSEYGFLAEVYLKSVKHSFINQTTLEQHWKSHNFLSIPDYKQALKEYSAFRKIFEDNGTRIFEFPADVSTTIDSIYCRDASIQTDGGVILCTMGKALRRHEPTSCGNHYSSSGHKILGDIEAPGTLEGGDVAWLDDKTLAVACGYRTNAEGIRQLRKFLEPQGVEVIEVDLPHYKGPSDVFHLMSVLSPVDNDLAVVYSPLVPVRFRNYLLSRGMQLVEVPDSEFDTLGCNVLAIAPRKCVIEQGNPVTIERLRKAGAEVITFSGSHICVPGGGGPTCLTRPVARMV
jgi:N-dimethylarginine dimethylaminohydrolase